MTHRQLALATTGTLIPGHTLVGMISDEKRHVCAFLSDDKSNLVIAFDGTRGNLLPLPSADWLSNLKFWTKHFTVGNHYQHGEAGFVEEFESELPTLLSWITLNHPQTIQVAGFSQGGAHATLLWDYLRFLYSTTTELVTLGAPTVLTEWTADYLNSHPRWTATAYQLWGDPVWGILPWPYKVVGKVVRPNKYRLFPSFRIPNPYHNIDAYVEAL